jgi:hypothetical protein
MPNYRVVCAIYFWLEVLKDIILNSIPLALGATINYFRIEGSGITQKIDSLNAPPVYITLPTATRIVPKTITVVERIIGMLDNNICFLNTKHTNRSYFLC